MARPDAAADDGTFIFINNHFEINISVSRGPRRYIVLYSTFILFFFTLWGVKNYVFSALRLSNWPLPFFVSCLVSLFAYLVSVCLCSQAAEKK